MASNNIVFQQTTNKSGDTEFRVKFGRSKSLVYRRHEQYYYIDVYDNRPGRSKFNGICFGLDEIDFLLSIRSNLDSLKTCFPQVVCINMLNTLFNTAFHISSSFYFVSFSTNYNKITQSINSNLLTHSLMKDCFSLFKFSLKMCPIFFFTSNPVPLHCQDMRIGQRLFNLHQVHQQVEINKKFRQDQYIKQAHSRTLMVEFKITQ